MNKVVIGIVSLLVGLGFGYFVHNGANQEASFGARPRTIVENFVNGLYAGTTNQLSVDESGNLSTSGNATSSNMTAATYRTASVGSSSSTNASLGSASAGFLTIGTSTPATRIVNASTTAVTIRSQIFVTQSATTTVAGTTCNSTPATSTIVTHIWPGVGFTLSTGSIPTTNPNCYYYRILN
jgi:hypothetical protein